MNTTIAKANANTLAAELKWLIRVIDTRFNLYFGKAEAYQSIYDIEPPNLSNDDSCYAESVAFHHMNFKERMILILALTPHLQPKLLDVFFMKNADYDRCFTEFGGITGKNHAGFLPTGETAAFILAADNLEERFSVTGCFGKDHFFQKHKILHLCSTVENEPFLSCGLSMYAEYLDYVTNGQKAEK